jgi:TolB protein
LLVLILFIFAGLLLASSVLASGPSGASPLDPLMVPTDWQAIASSKTLWFYFDYGISSGGAGLGRRSSSGNRNVSVMVQANGVPGIQFAIYTPAQATDWLRDQATTPVGRGTPYRDTSSGNITRDLYWAGAFNSSGRYFVAIENKSPNPISFRLTVTGDAVTLYPPPTPTATATIPALLASTPAPTATLEGKIVFQTATGGAIYTVNGDGDNLNLLTYGIDPAWSPDGKQIVFARWGSVFPGLYVINSDGSNEQLVYGAPRIRSPRWSPDGKHIAFTQEKTSQRDTKWKLGVIEINKVIEAETTKNVLTEPQCTNLCFTPSWNSNSATLGYLDPGVGVMATNIVSGSAWLVLGPTGTYFDTSANIARPIPHLPPIQASEWSPDGKRIIYSKAAHDRWELQLVNADGSNSASVTSPDPVLYTLFGVVVNNVAPTWSPDSREILFLSDRNKKWEFFVADSSGTNIRQVLKNVTDQITLRFDFENERMMHWVR